MVKSKSCALLCAVGVFCHSCSRDAAVVILPNTITNIIAGYPFALRVKNQMERDAHLTMVTLHLDRRGQEFGVQQIGYGFISPSPNGRVFVVLLDNARHEAYGAAMKAPASPHVAQQEAESRTGPLNLSTITDEVSDILGVAKPNGLAEFCSMSSPQEGQVELRLFNSQGRAVWVVIGDAWDEKGPIADLAITIDAQTKAVLSRSFEKRIDR